MTILENVSRPFRKEESIEVNASPFEFPKPKPGEEATEYVTTLKPDCPKEYFSIGGVTFAKKIYHPDKTLVSNQAKEFLPLQPMALLYPNEAEYIRKRAEKVQQRIQVRNPKFYDDPENEARVLSVNFKASDWIVLEPYEKWFEEKSRSHLEEMRQMSLKLKAQRGNREKKLNEEDPYEEQAEMEAPISGRRGKK